MTRDRNPAQALQNLQAEYEKALAVQEAIETYLLASSDDFLKPEEMDLMEGAEGLIDLVVWRMKREAKRLRKEIEAGT